MEYKEAARIVGQDWVEWFAALDPELKPVVIETQIGFALAYRRCDLSDAFKAIHEHLRLGLDVVCKSPQDRAVFGDDSP